MRIICPRCERVTDGEPGEMCDHPGTRLRKPEAMVAYEGGFAGDAKTVVSLEVCGAEMPDGWSVCIRHPEHGEPHWAYRTNENANRMDGLEVRAFDGDEPGRVVLEARQQGELSLEEVAAVVELAVGR